MFAKNDVEENFFKELINKEVIIYLISGIKLSGLLLEESGNIIIIDGKKGDGSQQLIYKNAISTVCPK